MTPDVRATAATDGEPVPLRILTCGSVDDGKSTLIGRLLFDQGGVYDDEASALRQETLRRGTAGVGPIDFSLLVDGLEAEREQGITIDVAYRYFRTARRAFVVIDAPGHEQYTRNMATGASNADLAILLVDARKGLLRQTQRHAAVAALLGVRHVVLAVNKIDLVGFSQAAFAAIVEAFEPIAAKLGFTGVVAIPISARDGDNLSRPSPRTPWYAGPLLITHLEEIVVASGRAAAPFRLSVQAVVRAGEFRGLAGTIAAGRVAVGDEVAVSPSGRRTTIARLLVGDAEREWAEADDVVTLVLAEDVDAARGDLLARPNQRPQVSDAFTAQLIWINEVPLHFGRSYLLKIATRTVPATVRALDSRLNVDALDREEGSTLRLNDIGTVTIATYAPIAFDRYDDCATTGGFILIDRASDATVAAGLIDGGPRAASAPARSAVEPAAEAVTRDDRARLKGQTPGVVWFTGLSGAGKSTLANALEAALNAACYHTILLDGDAVRHGLTRDLGFTQADRLENIRRVAEVARLMADAGLIVLCSFISPFREERRMAREIAAVDPFLEVYVDTPLATCIARDPKGLYRRALAGEVRNFTGISQAYEPPETPDLAVGREGGSVADALTQVLALLGRRGLIRSPDDLL